MMNRLLPLALLLAFGLPAVSHAAPSDFVPPSDPGFQNADTLQNAGVVLGRAPGTYSRRPPGRHDFAAAIVRLMQQIGGDPEQANRLTASPSALAALNALVAEFTPELTAMGQSVPQYKSALAALAPGRPLVSHPFSDVPPNHWAASAVETLRQRGIVTGYPVAGKK